MTKAEFDRIIVQLHKKRYIVKTFDSVECWVNFSYKCPPIHINLQSDFKQSLIKIKKIKP